jgi:hypothetical protein
MGIKYRSRNCRVGASVRAAGEDAIQMTNEEEVRASWTNVEVHRYTERRNILGEGPYFRLEITPNMDDSTGSYGIGLDFSDYGYCEDEVWKDAADFTRARREEIRQVDEEIDEERELAAMGSTRPGARLRTLDRLTAIRADLARGMKTAERSGA